MTTPPAEGFEVGDIVAMGDHDDALPFKVTRVDASSGHVDITSVYDNSTEAYANVRPAGTGLVRMTQVSAKVRRAFPLTQKLFTEQTEPGTLTPQMALRKLEKLLSDLRTREGDPYITRLWEYVLKGK